MPKTASPYEPPTSLSSSYGTKRPTNSSDITNKILIRQKVILTALGKALRGFCTTCQSCNSTAGPSALTGCSVAARPTNSVPAKEKAAVTKTLQTPLKPLANVPGFCQYLPPMYLMIVFSISGVLMRLYHVAHSLYSPLSGPPPRTNTSAENKKMMITVSLRHELQNSSSANCRRYSDK